MLFSLVILFLLNTVLVMPHVRAAEVTAARTVTTDEKLSFDSNQNVQLVDKVVGNLFQALNEDDYEKFSSYFNPQKSCTLSGGFNNKLSRETFTAMRNEMLQKGGLFINKKMISGSESMKWIRNDYQATFEKKGYNAQVGVIATSDTGEACVASFWIRWFDSYKTAAVNHITDEILSAIDQNDYGTFSNYFTNELKLKYTREEFAELNKNIVNELGAYQRKENTFFVEEKPEFSISSYLYYEKLENPIKFTINVDHVDGKTTVNNIIFQWVPQKMRDQINILAEEALITAFNDNNYDKFISYCDPQMKTVFTEDRFKEMKLFVNSAGRYIDKKYVGTNFIQTFMINEKKLKVPIEYTEILYKLTFEKETEMYLSIVAVRKNNEILIQHFYVNVPFRQK